MSHVFDAIASWIEVCACLFTQKLYYKNNAYKYELFYIHKKSHDIQIYRKIRHFALESQNQMAELRVFRVAEDFYYWYLIFK